VGTTSTHLAEARIPTTRGARYLTQLCDHLAEMSHGGHSAHVHHDGDGGLPLVRQIERTDRRAEIEFDRGRCVLTASADALKVQVQAENPDSIARGQELIGRRIETIGRRDHLNVTWQPLDAE
jgi:hypothetical protein